MPTVISLFILLADNISGIKSLLIFVWRERQDHPIPQPSSPTSQTSILSPNVQGPLELGKGPRQHRIQGVLLKFHPKFSPMLPSLALNNISALSEFLLLFYTLCIRTHLLKNLLGSMAPHSSTLAWKIPWTEEPGRLQSMGSLESDMTERLHFHFSLFTFMHWRRKWQPTPVFLPGESQGQGTLVGCHLWGRTESDMTEAT